MFRLRKLVKIMLKWILKEVKLQLISMIAIRNVFLTFVTNVSKFQPLYFYHPTFVLRHSEIVYYSDL